MATMIQWLLAASDMFFATRSNVATKEPARKPRSFAFKPGRRIEMVDGTRYEVQPNGAWKRTSLRLVERRILAYNGKTDLADCQPRNRLRLKAVN